MKVGCPAINSKRVHDTNNCHQPLVQETNETSEVEKRKEREKTDKEQRIQREQERKTETEVTEKRNPECSA